MEDRRSLLKLLGASVTASVAGCTTTDDSPGETTDSSTQELPRPGEPVRQESGSLPIHSRERLVGTRSDGFSSGETDTFDTSVDADGSSASFAPEHAGSGKASGLGGGTYQTTWKAPEAGKYRMGVKFIRSGGFFYNIPDDGSVMSSFDVSTQVIEPNEPRVVSQNRFEQAHQSSNVVSGDDIAEFIIEVGVSAILGQYLGLGLIGRAVLGRIVNELIDLDAMGQSGGEYDVAHRVEANWGQPAVMYHDLQVPEGAELIFETSPMLSWGYDLTNSRMEPVFDSSFTVKEFFVERL